MDSRAKTMNAALATADTGLETSDMAPETMMDIDSESSLIMRLPVELLLNIASHLLPHSAMLFALTCKKHWQIPSKEIRKQIGPNQLEGNPPSRYLHARRYLLLYLYRDLEHTHSLLTWNSGFGAPRPWRKFWELNEREKERAFSWRYMPEGKVDIGVFVSNRAEGT